MAKMGTVQNGLKKPRKSNAAKKTANPSKTAPKRRTVSLLTAKNILKKNGLKAVSRTANPKRKRKGKKRNGLATAKTYTARNGILGNSKQDAKTVGGVLGGAVGVKAVSRFLTPMVAPYLAKVGAGNFAEILVDGALALIVAPVVARKIGGPNAGANARLGGLLVVALDAIEMTAPNLLSFNPFNTSPVVVNGGQVGIKPSAVAELMANSSATPQEKASVGRAMRMLETGASPANPGGAGGGMNRTVRQPFAMRLQ